MSKSKVFIAFDLGASSGRGVAGLFDGERLRLQEIQRFPNGPTEVLGRLYWDVLGLFQNIKDTISVAAQNYDEITSIGVDTWGVDFGLLGDGDELLGNPYHYRDKRTDGIMEETFKIVPREEVFKTTGIQFMQLNTLYQLMSMVISRSPLLRVAETMLLMPDLINFWLTGVKVAEFSIATTTQFYDPNSGNWAFDMLERLGIPTKILPEIVPSGTVLGDVLESVGTETGLTGAKVVAPTCHDTASAVAAVPARGQDWIYLSSGTWSLMGVELTSPVINDDSLAMNFTNEGGYGGTIRFLKNIAGLWLVQECRRIWAKSGSEYEYSELTQIAKKAKPFKCFVDPDHPSFLSPGDMPARIQELCRKTGQDVPETHGEIIRCALESLAMKYRWVMECLESILGRKQRVIHIVGGGVHNELLCQLTADATGKTVLAGPAEATAIGNIMVQAMADGSVGSHQEAREIVRNSFQLNIFEPKSTDAWDAASERYLEIMKASAEIE